MRSTRDQAGVVLPTRLVVASIVLVALAGLFYLATQPSKSPKLTTPAAAKPTTSTPTAVVAPSETPKPKPPVKRSGIYVEVYNNSGIPGLAGRTATKAQAVGWNVVGSDNWYGTIDGSTVYFPARLRRAAHLLARDLGITRTKSAIAPMRLDRLTVILTKDYS